MLIRTLPSDTGSRLLPKEAGTVPKSEAGKNHFFRKRICLLDTRQLCLPGA